MNATTLLSDPFTHTAGFGGLMAVLAALIAASGVLVTVVQRSRADRHDAWWARFAWASITVPQTWVAR